MNLVWLFLKLGLFRYDTASIGTSIHKEIVGKRKLMTEDVFQRIASSASVSFGSHKLTYAVLVGKELGGIFLAIGYVALVFFPSFLLYIGVFYGLNQILTVNQFEIIQIGVIPVLAAYFLNESWSCLVESSRNFSKLFIVLIGIISFVLVFVLAIPISFVLGLMIVFFLCFIKGGSIHD